MNPQCLLSVALLWECLWANIQTLIVSEAAIYKIQLMKLRTVNLQQYPLNRWSCGSDLEAYPVSKCDGRTLTNKELIALLNMN